MKNLQMIQAWRRNQNALEHTCYLLSYIQSKQQNQDLANPLFSFLFPRQLQKFINQSKHYRKHYLLLQIKIHVTFAFKRTGNNFQRTSTKIKPHAFNTEYTKNIITKIRRSKFHLPCSTGGSSIVNCNEGMYIVKIASGTYRERE